MSNNVIDTDAASQRYQQLLLLEGLARLGARVRDYVILFRDQRGGEVFEACFTGTASQRLQYMQALRINTELGAWAAGYVCAQTGRWLTCGPDQTLVAMITSRPC